MHPKPRTSTRIFRAAVFKLLPRAVAEHDGDDMVATFDDLAAAAPNSTQRCQLLLRSLFGLLQVSLLEHVDSHRRLPSEAHPNRTLRKEGTMQRIVHDLQFALRSLTRAPSYTVSSVFLLALGIGAVTSSFTLFDNILLRSLPYPDAERIVYIEDGSHSGPFWRALQSHESIETWAGGWTMRANLTGQGDPIGIRVAQVSEDFFGLFGAKATEGRLLMPDDFKAPNRVVLGFDFWRETLGADADLVGKTIELNGESVTVVGVVERAFQPPEALLGASVDAWRPMPWADEAFQSSGYHVLQIAGRLKAGFTLEDFRGETQATVVRLDEGDTGRSFRDREGNLWQAPVSFLADITVRSARVGLNLLLGAVALLLLIACSNVAHLSVARGLGRTQEMALRRALGANTTSLVRQLVVESAVVAAIGGIAGIGLANLALRGFLAVIPVALPRGAHLVLDLRIVLFALAISLGTVLLFGLLPALVTVRNLTPGVRSRASNQSRSSRLLRNGLVAAEVALSLILLVGAGVLLRSFTLVNQQETGIETESVWRVPLSPPDQDTPAPYVAQMESINAALQTVTGVESVTHGLTMPFAFVGGHHCCWSTGITMPGASDEPVRISLQPVSADYFATLGIPLSQGVSWTAADALNVPIPVVLPQSTAAELFGTSDGAVGRTLSMRNLPELEVVAVAGDVRHYGLDQRIRTQLYLPIERVPFGVDLADFAIKVAGPAPQGFARSVREAIWSVAPDLPIPTVQPMDALIGESTAERRFESILFGGFGIVALLLAAAGLYGTLLYSVGQQRREMGIRLALGARRRTVEAQVLRSGAWVALLGVGLGLAGAWATTTLLESRIWGVEARDTASLLGATGLLIATALLACWLPARRAGRTDPVETLRAE